MKWLKLLGILALVAAAAMAGSAIWAFNTLSKAAERSESELVTVKPGQAFSQIARDFYAHNIVAHPKLWTIYAVFTNNAERVQAGEYEIPAHASPLDVLEKLVSGEVTQYSFTIVEGWTFRQMLDSLRAHPKLNIESQDLADKQLMAAIGAANLAAEGQFLADTYQFPAGTTDLEVLRRAHLALLDALDQEWRGRAVGVPLDDSYAALILASIIEKETGVAEERARISGVFTRRLQQGMRLQTDPTVIYGLGDSYQGNLTRKHLKQDTPYNTYTRRGLPPTPIALVGVASLKAALQPEQSSELYFVAKGDGSHFFSDTLEQHNRAVREYQLNRVENYRSAPANPSSND